MKGFMHRRGDAWELRVYLGTDPVTGKQRYATRTVRGGKREAQRVLNEMVTGAERGLSVRTNATAGELIEAWFEHASGDFSPKTVKETRGFIDRNLLPAIGEVPLSKLKASDLDRLYRRLQATGAVGDGGLAPATVRRIHGILRRALAQGVKWGWLGINPAAATTPPRVPQSEIAPPSGPDVARDYDALGSPRRTWRATSCWRRRQGRDGRSWSPCGGETSTSRTARSVSSAASSWVRLGSSRRTPRPTPPAESPSTLGRSTSSGLTRSG